MIVEPSAGDSLEDNLGSVGRIFCSASTMLCVPVSRSQAVDAALGAPAGEQTDPRGHRRGAGSPGSGAPPRHRSTTSTRPGREHAAIRRHGAR